MEYRWEYLRHKIMVSRYALADYFLGDCTDIIEIGGIGDYDSGSLFKSVVICDPLCTLESTPNVTYIKNFFENVNWDMHLDKGDAIIGLRILGVDLNLNEKGLNVMESIIGRVNLIVLEGALDHQPAMNDFKRMVNFCKNEDVVADFEIDYSRSSSKVGSKFLRRRVVVMENQLLKNV